MEFLFLCEFRFNFRFLFGRLIGNRRSDIITIRDRVRKFIQNRSFIIICGESELNAEPGIAQSNSDGRCLCPLTRRDRRFRLILSPGCSRIRQVTIRAIVIVCINAG